MNQVERVADLIKDARKIAVFTGAGISTASGIPDFRSAAGIYPAESNTSVFDLSLFRRDPDVFYTFARTFYPTISNAQPNAAHDAIVQWQGLGKDVAVITQNVDDLHQRAGSDPVYTVHGDYTRSTCLSCHATVETATLAACLENGDIPTCDCSGVFKPDITFFGEMLPEHDWEQSIQAVQQSDLVVVLGTSLTVYPAALMPTYRNHDTPLIIVNQDPTPMDGDATAVIHADLCSTLIEVNDRVL